MTASGPVLRDDQWNRLIVRAEHRSLGLDNTPEIRAGTAFFITPTRLLTAAHLVDPDPLTADIRRLREREDAAKACKVHLDLDTGEVEAAVVDIDLTLDAVLLEIPTGAAVTPPRLLDLDNAAIRMQRWWSRGYPSTRGEGKTLTMSGTVSNASNRLNLDDVSVTTIELSRSQGTHDPHGYSGGPVILKMPDGKEWIIGLVRRKHDDPDVIWASPIHLVARRFATHGPIMLESLAPPSSATAFLRLTLWRQGSDRLCWHHEPPAPDFGPWWNLRSDRRGQLVLNFSPFDEPALVSAIGRLALHGGLARIAGRDAAAWRTRIEKMTKDGLPVSGDKAETHVAAMTFDDTASPPVTPGAPEVVTAELARQIHRDLDQETLKHLNEVVARVLEGDRTLTKWRIEDDLAAAMREIWENWFRALEMDQPTLRAFLKLLLQAGRPDRRLPDHPPVCRRT